MMALRKTIGWSAICLVVLLVSGTAVLHAEEAGDEGDRIARVLAEVPLIDGHNDAPWAIRSRVDNTLAGFDFRDTTNLERPMHTDLDRLQRGGVGAQFWSVWVPTDLEGGDAVLTVIEQIDLVHRLNAAYPDELELALTAADIRRIHGQGRIASLIGVEGGYAIGNSLAVLRQFYAIGARYMTLTHWQTTDWADAATDEPKHGGLSTFGESVVREMNRLGMMVDLSHVSEECMNDVLDIAKAPVIFSHSGAQAVNPHPRNVSDEVLRRVQKNGGIVMVNFGSFFVDERVTERWAEVKAEKARLETLHPGHTEYIDHQMENWYEEHPVPAVPIGRLADHIDHIRTVAGIDHIGLGSDYDGIGSVPEGMDDVSCYPALLEELAGRGYTDEELGKIAGLNLLRVMEAVEQAAAELQKTESPVEERFQDED